VAGDIETILEKGDLQIPDDLMKLLDVELTKTLKELEYFIDELETLEEEKSMDFDKASYLLETLEPMLLKANPICFDLLDDIRSLPDTEKLVQLIEVFDFKKATVELVEVKEKWGI
jgi:hypothetical protein